MSTDRVHVWPTRAEWENNTSTLQGYEIRVSRRLSDYESPSEIKAIR